MGSYIQVLYNFVSALMAEEKLSNQKKVSVAGIEPAALRKCSPQRSDLTPNRYQRYKPLRLGIQDSDHWATQTSKHFAIIFFLKSKAYNG